MPEAEARPTRPPVSSPSVAAKRLADEAMGLLYRPLRSTAEAWEGRRAGTGTHTGSGGAQTQVQVRCRRAVSLCAPQLGTTALPNAAALPGTCTRSPGARAPVAKRSSRLSRGTRTDVNRMAPLSMPFRPTCKAAWAAVGVRCCSRGFLRPSPPAARRAVAHYGVSARASCPQASSPGVHRPCTRSRGFPRPAGRAPPRRAWAPQRRARRGRPARRCRRGRAP